METPVSAEDRLTQGKKGVYVSIATYVLLAVVKILIGVSAASHALVADGWNNATDVAASIAILIGLNIATKPADQDHRYGHFRAETAAALIAAIVMAVVGLDVIRSGIKSLFSEKAIGAPDILSLYVALGSALLSYMVFRYNYTIGKRTNNMAVLATAYDNRSDALVSMGTVAGVGFAQAGFYWADPIVACVVGIMILKTGWIVGREAVHSLMDGFEEEKLSEFQVQIKKVEGVREVIDLRARYHGSHVHVDVTIGVDHHLTVIESHQVTERIEEALLGLHTEVERVYVHVEPALLKKCRA